MTVTQATESAVVPSALRQALEWVGLRWPEGDASKLSAAGDAWIEYARAMREALQGNNVAAESAAARVWDTNRGLPIDAFRRWWTASRGPSANISGAVVAAENIGAALKGMSVQVSSLKALYVANLTSLVTMLVGAGVAIFLSGGLLALVSAGAATAAIAAARRAMLRALERALMVVAASLIGVMLFQAAGKLVPAPRETTVDEEEPKPDPRRPPPPPPPPFFPRRPRCSARPGPLTPVITGIQPGSPEAMYAGDGLQRIDKRVLPGGARQVTIEGVIRNPLVARADFEDQMNKVTPQLRSLGIPRGEYHWSHTWGAGFGSEAAAGIYASPTEMNLSYQRRAEIFVQGLHQSAGPDGWVELRAVTTTHPPAAFGGYGDALTASTDYEATVCRAGRVIESYNFGIEAGLPRVQNGVFQPGRITTYGFPSGIQ
jgi:hypothetical protein